MNEWLLVLALALLQEQQFSVEIAPASHEEPCIELSKGQRLEFGYSASAAVDFNLHYHSPDGISFPVDKQAVTLEQGVYIAPFDQTYCLMWSNTSRQPVSLKYHYRVLQLKDNP